MAENKKNKKRPKAKEKKTPKKKKDTQEVGQMKKKDEKKEEKQEKKKEAKNQKEPKKILPPLDFSSLVLPFFTQALIELGETEDPEAKNIEENLQLTQRLIDLLGLLREKTYGNLKSEEERFLDQCLHQLRMAYMEKAKIISL